jgi:hypothetical protein
MAIVQALVAMIGRSAGKVLNAVFGWAVRALFGRVSGAQQTLLTIAVSGAAVWPLLLVGVLFPRTAAFLLTFVPIPKSVPESAIRAVWFGLAVTTPGVLGLALAAKAPSGRSGSFLTRVARGYPITVGLAAAFIISFVSVPLLRLASAARRHSDADVPLIIPRGAYAEIGRQVERVLNSRGFKLFVRRPPVWLRAPMDVMRTLGGDVLRDYVPERLIYLVGPDLEVALYPASVLLRGPARLTVLAHGLLVEALTATRALQTTDAKAQDLEKQIQRVWSALAENPEAHRDASMLLTRVRQISDELLRLEAPYDDWQTVYRELLQLARAVHAEPQLLELTEEKPMEKPSAADISPTLTPAPGSVEQLSTVELLSEIASRTADLMSRELALAQAEIKRHVESELAALKSAAAAGVAALVCTNLLFVAAIFALAQYVEPWVSALAFAGALFLVALGLGLYARNKHVDRPLETTRQSVKDNIHWVEERLA